MSPTMTLPTNLDLSTLDRLMEETGGHSKDFQWKRDHPLTISKAMETSYTEDPDDARCAAIQLRKQAEIWLMLANAIEQKNPDTIPLHDTAGSGIKEVRALLEIETELSLLIGEIGVAIQHRQQMDALAVKFRAAADACAKAAGSLDDARFKEHAPFYVRTITERAERT